MSHKPRPVVVELHIFRIKRDSHNFMLFPTLYLYVTCGVESVIMISRGYLKYRKRFNKEKKMMWLKKRLIAVIDLSLLVAILIAFPAILNAQERVHANTGVENAAVYYSRAIDLLKYPDSQEIQDKLKGIIQHGWQAENREIVNILRQNERCLTEVQRGLLLETCDFDFGKKYKYQVERELPRLDRIFIISDLLLLKGRYYEKQGAFGDATEVYLSSLRLSGHISQGDDLVSKRIALAIEKKTYIPLRDYLHSKNIDKRVCQRILSQLRDFENKRFPARSMIEPEKEFFLSTVRMVGDGFKQRAAESLGTTPGIEKEADVFEKELNKQARELADRYYGNFIKAAETNKEGDWKFALVELEGLRKASQPTGIGNMRDVVSMLYDTFTGDIEEYQKKIIRKILITLLDAGLLNPKKVVDGYYARSAELHELRSVARIRCR